MTPEEKRLVKEYEQQQRQKAKRVQERERDLQGRFVARPVSQQQEFETDKGQGWITAVIFVGLIVALVSIIWAL